MAAARCDDDNKAGWRTCSSTIVWGRVKAAARCDDKAGETLRLEGPGSDRPIVANGSRMVAEWQSTGKEGGRWQQRQQRARTMRATLSSVSHATTGAAGG